MKLALYSNDGTVIANWSISTGKPEFDIEDLDAELEHDFYMEEYDSSDNMDILGQEVQSEMYHAKGRGIK